MDASNVIETGTQPAKCSVSELPPTLKSYGSTSKRCSAEQIQTVRLKRQLSKKRFSLKGLRPKYEAHHKAKLTDEALEAAVRLSDRYITGRFRPDKAIDVMDEAGARARINAMTRPPDVKELEQQIETMRSERTLAIEAPEAEKAAALRIPTARRRSWSGS